MYEVNTALASTLCFVVVHPHSIHAFTARLALHVCSTDCIRLAGQQHTSTH